MAKSYAIERKMKKHTNSGFTCCGKYYSGNGGQNHKKMHLLEEMPEYKGKNYSLQQLRQERMRRKDIETNYYGGMWKNKTPL